jgi:hypothetical protein
MALVLNTHQIGEPAPSKGFVFRFVQYVTPWGKSSYVPDVEVKKEAPLPRPNGFDFVGSWLENERKWLEAEERLKASSLDCPDALHRCLVNAMEVMRRCEARLSEREKKFEQSCLVSFSRAARSAIPLSVSSRLDFNRCESRPFLVGHWGSWDPWGNPGFVNPWYNQPVLTTVRK